MRTYFSGEQIVFRAQRDCVLQGRYYHKGDNVAVILQRPWNVREGFGSGGPWTTAGYTSRLIASLGKVVFPQRRPGH